MLRKILVGFFLFFIFLSFARSIQAVGNTVNIQNYCVNGYYEIPGEKKCSRAPKCGPPPYDNYDWVAQNVPMPDPNDCVDVSMVIGNPPNTNTPNGYFPLCCYEMERTGDFTKCVGYWERLWCASSQCANARTNGASDSQCGGNCQCAHATEGWGYSNVQPVSLETRLNFSVSPTINPTPTNTPVPTQTGTPPTATPTRTPTPTSIPIPTTTCSATNNSSITFAFQPGLVRNVVNFNNSGGLTLLAVNTTLQCSFTRSNINIVYNSTNWGGDFWTEQPINLPSGNYSFYLSGPRNLRQQFNGIVLSPNQALDCRTVNNTGCGDLGDVNVRVTKMLFTGDANRDNVINSIDYELYRIKVNQTGAGNNSDFDYNNNVEFTNGNNDDFLHFKNNFGKRGV